MGQEKKGGVGSLIIPVFLIIAEVINGNFTKQNQEVYKCQVL